MHFTDSSSSSIWRQNFSTSRAQLENINTENCKNEVLKVWISIPETLGCLKNAAIAVLSVFSSAYS
jgi:hypothetical protein